MLNINAINNRLRYQYSCQEIIYNIFPSLNTYLKDKNNQDIHIFDILQLDGRCVMNRKEYFVCIWNFILGRIEFLLFNYEINDFIWFDDIISTSFAIVSTCNNMQSRRIPKIIQDKVQTMMNFSNEYYEEVA